MSYPLLEARKLRKGYQLQGRPRLRSYTESISLWLRGSVGLSVGHQERASLLCCIF